MPPDPVLRVELAIGSRLASFAATDAPGGGWLALVDSPLRASVEGTGPPPVAVGVLEVAPLIWGTRARASADGIALYENVLKVNDTANRRY